MSESEAAQDEMAESDEDLESLAGGDTAEPLVSDGEDSGALSAESLGSEGEAEISLPLTDEASEAEPSQKSS